MLFHSAAPVGGCWKQHLRGQHSFPERRRRHIAKATKGRLCSDTCGTWHAVGLTCDQQSFPARNASGRQADPAAYVHPQSNIYSTFLLELVVYQGVYGASSLIREAS